MTRTKPWTAWKTRAAARPRRLQSSTFVPKLLLLLPLPPQLLLLLLLLVVQSLLLLLLLLRKLQLPQQPRPMKKTARRR